jgi:hypothetical protein
MWDELLMLRLYKHSELQSAEKGDKKGKDRADWGCERGFIIWD